MTSISQIDSYYKLLELPNPTYDINKIKQQYKQLVLKHHPDKGGNSQIFQKIQEAYEFLIHHSPGTTLNSPNQPYQGKCSDIHLTLEMTLADFYNGKKTPMIVTHDKICPKCQGKGYQQLSNLPPCQYPQPHPHPPTCSFCLGTSVQLTPETICPECKGIRIIKHRQHLNIGLPPGLRSGEQLTVLNVGNEFPQKARGKVYLKVIESKKRHPYFTRKGDDLHIYEKVHLTDALAGHQFNLTLLNQQQITIQTTSVITPNQNKAIPNLGMPLRNRPKKKGRLIIHFEVIFPKKLTPYQHKPQLQTLLQQPGSTIHTPDQSQNQSQNRSINIIKI